MNCRLFAPLFALCCWHTAAGQTIELFSDSEEPTTGNSLDEIAQTDLPLVVPVVEIPGLNLSITAFTGIDFSGFDVNSTASSLGVNSEGGSDEGEIADRLEQNFDESITFQFDQTVTITQVDFDNFEEGEIFDFAGTIINFDDLTSTFTDIFDFPAPGLTIPANTPFTVATTSDLGSIGLDTITLAPVIPEPSSAALASLGLVSLAAARRRREATGQLGDGPIG